MKYSEREAFSTNEAKRFDTSELRDNFLIKNVMVDGEINLTYSYYDRYIAGGAVPTVSPIPLVSIDPLKADYFLQRREMGIINIGGSGTISVDGTLYSLGCKDALYIGKGSKEVIFDSDDYSNKAKFYINSAPAHHTHLTTLVNSTEAEVVELGSLETANARTVNKLIVNSIVQTCQLQMGMTEMKMGSVWNTMPAHTHSRRMEIYFYFDMSIGHSVCHFMGEPQETRHLWIQNEEAVISPPWSIHSGSGTGKYTFIWGMAGENLDYGDMDVCEIKNLR